MATTGGKMNWRWFQKKRPPRCAKQPRQLQNPTARRLRNLFPARGKARVKSQGETQMPATKKSQKHTRARRIGTAVSMKACAALTGLTFRAVQAAKDAGCPAIKQNGRVDCDALIKWLANHPPVLEGAS